MVAWRRACKIACGCVGIVCAVFAVLLFVAFIRAATLEDLDYQEAAIAPGPVEDLPEWYLEGLPKLMAKALSIPTVSRSRGDINTEEIIRFHDFLRESFPSVYNATYITVETVNNYSLLYTIQGSDINLQPYLLMSHMDVVPVVEEQWSHDPFGGLILPDPATGEEYIWGRGAIDDKLGVMAIMMALNYLAMTDFRPARSFYVAFGHDEEVSGLDGAGEIAKVLDSRGVKQVEFVLDEGMPILVDVIKGVEVPVAAIGVAEKGYMNVEIVAEGEGGHSSMPPSPSAVSRLAAAISNVETNPQPSMFGRGPEADMLTYLAPKASWPYKLFFSNLWLFKPVLEWVMSSSRDTNAVLRTTTSTTIVRAGIKDNVVPVTAHANINHRLHPAQTEESVLEHDRAVINDPAIKMRVKTMSPASPVSPYGPEVAPWRLISAAIHHHLPGSVTVPGTMVGGTDSSHYLNLSRHVYRLNPSQLHTNDLVLVHGHNEMIPVSAPAKATIFFFFPTTSSSLLNLLHPRILTDLHTPMPQTLPGHRLPHISFFSTDNVPAAMFVTFATVFQRV